MSKTAAADKKQILVRLAEKDIPKLDRLVKTGGFRSRQQWFENTVTGRKPKAAKP